MTKNNNKGGHHVNNIEVKISKFVINLKTLTFENMEDVQMAVTKEIAKALKSLESSWETAEVRTPGSGLPDGDYAGKIVGMDINTSKKGRLQVVTRFKIVDGKNKGAEVMRFDGIDNDTSMSYFKGYCDIIGMDIPSDISDLPETLEEFVDSNKNEIFSVNLKTKDEYQNVYVKGGQVDEDELSGEESGTESSDEEEEKPKSRREKEKEKKSRR